MKKITFFILLVHLFVVTTYSQNDPLWTRINAKEIRNSEVLERISMPKTFDLYSLDLNLLKTKLKDAPTRLEYKNKSGVVVSFPNTNGFVEEFNVFEAPVVHPDLAAKYPELKSYVGIGIDDPTARIRFSVTLFGVHTMVFSGNNGTSYIDTYTKDLNKYIVYSKKDISDSSAFECATIGNSDKNSFLKNNTLFPTSSNGIFRTYRLAVSSTVEYSNFHIAAAGLNAGTTAQKKAAVLAAMVVTITRVNEIYENDLSVTLQFVSNNDALISIGTDNFNNNNGGTLLGQNQTFINNIIGSANYDIGHIFSTGGGGVAQLGSVCGSSKAQGVTGLPTPVNDAFSVDYVAHEIGHQFGANHTFNGDQGSCNGNRNDATAIEPGSGSTIMAYAGICAPQDVQSNSDAYFSIASLIEIDAFINSDGNCSQNINNNNSAPQIEDLQNYTIPKSTPFILKAVASDVNNSNLTYCWEQTNNEIAVQPPLASNSNGPNFRSIFPTSSPERYFPLLSSVVDNNITPTWEVIPSVARVLNFALTVRDNSSPLGGQTATKEMNVTIANAGPFLVASPNTSVSWSVGSNQNITWDVAGTTSNGINTAFVDIYLSADGGVSFPVLLASKVPNDGIETITIPNNIGDTNRIMVKANNNVFYDISNSNFTIESAPSPTFSIAFSGNEGDENKIVCPNVPSTSFDIVYAAISGFSANTVFSVTGNPSGSTVVFSPNTIAADGNVTMTLNNLNNSSAGFYTLAVTATSGSITKNVNFYLQLSLLPINLATPVNNAVTQNTTLNLTWIQEANASSYDIEIATDISFFNIINTANVTGTNYTVSGLLSATDYFWRVRPKNSECTGAFSSINKFSTGLIVCSIINSTNVPILISGSGTPTINSNLNIPTSVIISDLNVSAQINHSWVSDLTITLISPSGTQIKLIAAKCGDGDNINSTFDDAGNALVCGTNPSISGTILPLETLSLLNGQSSQGNWILRVKDNETGDGGALVNWSMEICKVEPVPLSVTQQSFVNFSIFPNPNNGSFNIQLENAISENITIQIVDLRGRSIFKNNYPNIPFFNKNINLQNI